MGHKSDYTLVTSKNIELKDYVNELMLKKLFQPDEDKIL
jgi:hypothetical protein